MPRITFGSDLRRYTAGESLPASVLAVLALSVASTPQGGSPKGGYRVEPPGAWVERSAPRLAAPTAEGVRGGLHLLLLDDQVRLGPGPVERYHHRARRITASPGVEPASEQRIEFDPGSEQLVLHEVTVHRGSARIDALRRADVRILQREEALDRQVVDGRLTAVLYLRDVRVGDVVEAAWTIRGGNPALAGRWAGAFGLGLSLPLDERRVRVVAPVGSPPLAWRAHGIDVPPDITARGGTTEWRWRRSEVAAVEDEADRPAGVDSLPWIEVSQWPDWGSVVSWALPLYEHGAAPPVPTDTFARWRALPTTAARATAALRFVQDEVRYLGLELGAGSYRPRPPPEVSARRFGDCKDKALLLVASLRELGIEASPALVDTEDGEAVAGYLPSPRHFDHAIVRAVIDGQERWLEPTRSLERAPLTEVRPPDYRWALVIAPGQHALVPIPPPPPASLQARSHLRVTAWGAPAELEIETTLGDSRAISMRHELSNEGAERVGKSYLEHYRSRYPGLSAVAPLEVEDAADRDRLVLRERYRLPSVREGDALDFGADTVVQELKKVPVPRGRTLPLRVPHPALVRERVLVTLPGPPALMDEDRTLDTEASHFSRKARARGNEYALDLEYRSTAAAVPAAAVPEYVKTVQRMEDLALFSLTLRGASPRNGAAISWGAIALLTGFLTGGALLFIGVVAAMNGDLKRWVTAWRQRRRLRAFRAAFAADRGETPDRPLTATGPAEVAAAVRRLACSCGGRLEAPPPPWDRITFGGRELGTLRATCGGCGASRPVYVSVERSG